MTFRSFVIAICSRETRVAKEEAVVIIRFHNVAFEVASVIHRKGRDFGLRGYDCARSALESIRSNRGLLVRYCRIWHRGDRRMDQQSK
jgi:hypothetical protein